MKAFTTFCSDHRKVVMGLAAWNELRVRGIFLAVACGLLVAGFVYRAAQEQESAPVKSTQLLMDTVVEQRVFGPNAKEAVRQAEELLRRLESEQSLFLSSSEVAAINENAGIAPVEVSERTFEIIRLSVEFSKASGGDFDITTAPLKELWSITGESLLPEEDGAAAQDSGLHSPPRIPEQSEIDALLPLVNYSDIVLDEAARTVFLKNRGQSIDLGGVAKGYAAQECVGIYRKYGVNGYINIGGNVAEVGGTITIGIRAPRGDISYFGSLSLGDNVMATSGDYERYFEKDGTRYHHILNPKTGRPSQSGLISVSVICRDGAQADFLSTTLFLRGRNGLDSLRSAYQYEYVAVDANRNVILSSGLRDQFRLNPEASGYHLIA